MSDAKDAVRTAKTQNQRLAASCMVRKEALAAELAILEKQKASAAQLLGSSDPRTSAEASAILRSIEQRMAEKQAELASVDRQLEEALEEVRQLEKLAGRAAAVDAQGIAASALGGDPIIRSPEELALDNARSHIANLNAQTRIDSRGAEVKASSPLMTEAEARAKLQEMRAKLASGSKPTVAKPLDPVPPRAKSLDPVPSDANQSDPNRSEANRSEANRSAQNRSDSDRSDPNQADPNRSAPNPSDSRAKKTL
jgi:hypothetical protein